MGAVYWEGKDYSDLKSCINALLHVATKLEKEMTVEELFFGSDIFPNIIMSIEKLYNQACMIKSNNRYRESDLWISERIEEMTGILDVAKDIAKTILKLNGKTVSSDLKAKAMFISEGFEKLTPPRDI